MRLIKKIDLFILKKFLQLFLGSFFVCLLVFMMQFTWRYVDDLIGKGLTLDVLGLFFWYMGQTLVPTSLPLAVLLASLLTFSNMGESLELLSMKAAGISLLRVMASLIIFCTVLTGTSFYFQNKTSPEAQISLRTLLISMRQTSPAVEIPEGVFYSGVPNVNLYVQRKVQETGMLYQVIIYKTDQGFDRAQIVLADSARMEMSSDKQHLTLDLWDGEQFENLQSGNMSQLGNVPYDRETFLYKHLIIDFDANFNMMDGDMLRGMASAKSEWQIVHDIDSLRQAVDSVGRVNRREAYDYHLRRLPGVCDSVAIVAKARGIEGGLAALMNQMTDEERAMAQAQMSGSVRSLTTEFQWRRDMIGDVVRQLRLHQIEFHQKWTLALACLLFFFIGAPLGAAIGKGGIGLSAVVSTVIFILYYIVNTSGMKMGRQGEIPVWIGMWASTVIMLPCGVWLTWRAHHDKLNININAIWNTIKRFPLWQLLRKPSKTSVKAVWSSLSMTKIAKMKAISSWLPKRLRRKP